jgi:hypothetical protein
MNGGKGLWKATWRMAAPGAAAKPIAMGPETGVPVARVVQICYTGGGRQA